MRWLIAALTLAVGVAVAVSVMNSGAESTEPETATPNSATGPPLKIVATTGHIYSALIRITDGTEPTIKRFCGPGVDPHSFRASTRDIQAMQDADAIFYNGFHLEAQLTEHLHGTFADKAWPMSDAFPPQYRLDWVEDGSINEDAPFDPHIWNHLPGWAKCVEGLTKQLADIDPDNAELYEANGTAYAAELNELDTWTDITLSTIADDQRVIVSAHDAFNYFANNYAMQTLAVLGVGNDAEADIQTMRSVAIKICDQKIPVIFMEAITNPRVTQALREACQARDWDVAIISTPLFSDDLGETPPNDTFTGAFRSNVELIAKSLGGKTE